MSQFNNGYDDIKRGQKGSDRPIYRQFALNAAFSGSVSVIKTVIQIILIPLMAHLLSPTAYGLYALASPIVMFFTAVADGGLGLSLAREDEENDVVWSTAFWTLLLVCFFVSIIIVTLGYLLSRFTGQPSLIGIMALLSLVFPMIAVSVCADARLTRRGNGIYHSASDLIGTVIGAFISLLLAYQGAGAWALAAQYIASFLVRAVILNAFSWTTPSFIYDIDALKGHLAIGGGLLISRLGDLGIKFLENGLFGHIFGTEMLGAYTLASQISRFICESVVNPSVSAFYILSLKENISKVVLMHAKIIHLLMTFLLPTTMLMAYIAPSVFPILLGKKWIVAAPMFQGIVIPYSLAAVAWLGGQILIKHGMTRKIAYIVIGCGVIRIFAVVSGLWLSATAVAWFIGGTYVLQAAAMTLIIPNGLGANIYTVSKNITKPLLASSLGILLSTVIISRPQEDIISMIEFSITSGFIYIFITWIIDKKLFREDVPKILGLFTKL